MDLYVTTENLVQDLIQARVGQSKCPVVLIGHCIEGLVLKELCVSATGKVARISDIPIQNLLGKLRGCFFYATPHFGTNLAQNKFFERNKGCLFENCKPLNSEAARKREEFCELRKTRGWKTYGMGEIHEVTLGKFKGLFVPEASAKCDMDGFYTAEANHFNLCRPHARTSSSFIHFINFIEGVVKEAERQIHDEEPVHKCTGLPSNPVGLETRAHEVQEKLKDGAVLGIFGMGGIGKTTLAREVFNNISKDFEYTCFIDNVKAFSINELEKWVLENFYHNGSKLDRAKTQWSQMKGKISLIVMDDTNSEDQLKVLPALQNFGNGSCLIITSRDKEVFKYYENPIVYEVDFLQDGEATKLFCKHAFGSKDVPDHLIRNVHAVIAKCAGLPLTLEVMGRHLRDKALNIQWEQTIEKLQRAVSITGARNDRVWASLKVSYDDLSDETQEMFREAASFFFEEPLDIALAAWSYGNAETTWDNLVNRAMVKEVSNRVWVHEQLRDLAKNLAEGTMLSSIVVDNEGVVNTKRVSANTTSLRLKNYRKNYPTLQVDSLVWQQLKYVDIRGVRLEGEGKGLTEKLRLLRCANYAADSRPTFPISLINKNDLAVLQITGYEMPVDFPKTLGNLVNLRVLELENCVVPEGFLNASGNLKNMHILSRTNLKYSLPELELRTQEVQGCGLSLIELETLPDSFGALKSVRKLVLELPDSFGDSLALESLQFDNCPKLGVLPDSFGLLSKLKSLEFERCEELTVLPDTFGHLSALESLEFNWCPELRVLPDSFGLLSKLKSLQFGQCEELTVLPDTFGDLSALESLEFHGCLKLRVLPDSLGALSTLRRLELIVCEELQTLPESFVQLANLQHLEIRGEWDKIGLVQLPDSFEELQALRHLVFQSISLKRIPDCIKNLRSLHTLELGILPYVKDVPPWLGETGSTPVAFIHKVFQIRDAQFSLIKEQNILRVLEDGNSVERCSERMFWSLCQLATRKVSALDYEGALAILCLDNSGLLVRPWLQGFALQETGIIKRKKGDLAGALKDLTAALRIFSEADDLHCYAYSCLKHKGFVNFLLGKFDVAQFDGDVALKFLPYYCGYPNHSHGYTLWPYDLNCNSLEKVNKSKPRETLGEESVTYMHFTLKGIKEFGDLTDSSHSQVMAMVRTSDFSGALAVWDAYFFSGIPGYYWFFFLKERGVLKRLANELQGALEDLTNALEIDHNDYECLKHLAYVKYLLNDVNGARIDAERCLSMGLEDPGIWRLGEFPVAFLEFEL